MDSTNKSISCDSIMKPLDLCITSSLALLKFVHTTGLAQAIASTKEVDQPST